MAKGFKHGSGGGTSLNFKVVAYDTEELLKAATPKANTIGVITTTAISCWIFSATEPTAPEAGMVWIKVETSSDFEFNALKKNTIQVYPYSAKQYVDSAWKDLTCFTYVDSWKAWLTEIYLFNNGDKCTDVTGGWTTKNDENISVSVGSSKIAFNYGSDGGRSAAAYTVNKIDVSKYKTMVVTGNIINTDVSEEGRSFVFGITSSKTQSDPSSWVTSKTLDSKGEFEQTLDLSKVTEANYVCVYAHGSDVDVYTVLLR